MENKACTCGNTELGFNCVCDFVNANPGDREYSCEFCGLYKASRPQCNYCDDTTDLYNSKKNRDEKKHLLLNDPEMALVAQWASALGNPTFSGSHRASGTQKKLRQNKKAKRKMSKASRRKNRR